MIGFQILPFLKTFVTDFSGPMKTRQLKSYINMDNDRMYRVYRNRGQDPITLGVMSPGRFKKKNAFLLNNFDVCGPTSLMLTSAENHFARLHLALRAE